MVARPRPATVAAFARVSPQWSNHKTSILRRTWDCGGDSRSAFTTSCSAAVNCTRCQAILALPGQPVGSLPRSGCYSPTSCYGNVSVQAMRSIYPSQTAHGLTERHDMAKRGSPKNPASPQPDLCGKPSGRRRRTLILPRHLAQRSEDKTLLGKAHDRAYEIL